jgi:hypothetical protein
MLALVTKSCDALRSERIFCAKLPGRAAIQIDIMQTKWPLT